MPNNSNRAVIDLGSNTFHLMITDADLKVIFRDRSFVSLAEFGIGHIGEGAIARGKTTLKAFKEHLTNHNISNVKVIGTSALRSASNAAEVIRLFEEILSTKIEIIDGKREASLIAKGVQLLITEDMKSHTYLMMDIGGGSTEFSILKSGEVIFSNSYDIGIGVMHSKFHNEDPISKKSISDFNAYITTICRDLLEFIKKYQIQGIIGSSGTFETFMDVAENHQLITVDQQKVTEYINHVIQLDQNARARLENISEKRAKYIVEGYLLAAYFINACKPQEICVSPYALKEGLLSEM